MTGNIIAIAVGKVKVCGNRIPARVGKGPSEVYEITGFIRDAASAVSAVHMGGLRFIAVMASLAGNAFSLEMSNMLAVRSRAACGQRISRGPGLVTDRTSGCAGIPIETAAAAVTAQIIAGAARGGAGCFNKREADRISRIGPIAAGD